MSEQDPTIIDLSANTPQAQPNVLARAAAGVAVIAGVAGVAVVAQGGESEMAAGWHGDTYMDCDSLTVTNPDASWNEGLAQVSVDGGNVRMLEVGESTEYEATPGETYAVYMAWDTNGNGEYGDDGGYGKQPDETWSDYVLVDPKDCVPTTEETTTTVEDTTTTEETTTTVEDTTTTVEDTTTTVEETTTTVEDTTTTAATTTVAPTTTTSSTTTTTTVPATTTSTSTSTSTTAPVVTSPSGN